MIPPFPPDCTTCTNHTFDSPVIHFIHTNPPKLCGKLSTSKNADFPPFRSYAPSYPHYPQVFSSPQVDFTFSLYLFNFCEHLIKFAFATFFLPYPIDKPGRPRIVFELLYTFFTFLNFLIFHVFWLSFTEFCVILKPSQTKELILCVTQSAEKISTLHQA